VAQVIECLPSNPSKCEALNSNPTPPKIDSIIGLQFYQSMNENDNFISLCKSMPGPHYSPTSKGRQINVNGFLKADGQWLQPYGQVLVIRHFLHTQWCLSSTQCSSACLILWNPHKSSETFVPILQREKLKVTQQGRDTAGIWTLFYQRLLMIICESPQPLKVQELQIL
jgi:hypothetical protein